MLGELKGYKVKFLKVKVIDEVQAQWQCISQTFFVESIHAKEFNRTRCDTCLI